MGVNFSVHDCLLYGGGYHPQVYFSSGYLSLPSRGDSLYDSSRTSFGNRKGGGSHPLCSRTTSVIRTVGDTFSYLPSPCERLMWGWLPPTIMLRTFFVRYNWRNFMLSPSPFVGCAPLVGVHWGWLPPPLLQNHHGSFCYNSI